MAEQQLLDAVRDGNTFEISALLRAGADPNGAVGFSRPLHDAAILGLLGIARLLLRHGANVNAAAAHGYTALHFAAAGGHIELARLFLDRGADVTAAEESGRTALHYAAERGHADVARLLLDRGANIGAATGAQPDVDGLVSAQPLHLAAFGKHAAAVELLLGLGADMHARAARNAITAMTPLHFAASDCDGTPQQGAAVARALLDAGAQVDAATSSGQRPLHLAVYNGMSDTAALLLARGADANAADNAGEMPLHLACVSAFHANTARALACVQVLLGNGADINAPMAETGLSPLHLAVHYASDGVSAVMAELLQRGADPDAADAIGRTPLHYACDPPGPLEPSVIRALLERGAGAGAADESGRRPLHCLAARRPRQGDGSDDDEEDDGAVSDDMEDVEAVIRALQSRGADVDALDGEGRTPLMIAAGSRNGAASGALVRCGARVGPPECGRCADAGSVRAAVQRVVVGMAGEAARLRRERAALEQERAAWQQERAAIEQEERPAKRPRGSAARS